MENNPKISIIIPLYNAEKYIDRCMESVNAQTMKDFEVVLVNDGSTDNSAAICRRYASQDPRVTYIEKENGGAGSARNAGIEAAKGTYLAFPDADDWFEPEMYAELYALAQSGGYDVVFSGVNYYSQTPDGGVEYSRTQNIEAVAFTDRATCRKNIMTFFPTTTIFDVPWNKLYKRSIVTQNNVRFTDIRRCQDAMFNLDFYNCINSAASIDKAFYNYMENTTADVQRKFPKDYINVNIAYYSHLIELMDQWGVYSGDIRRHYDSTYVLSIYSTADRYDNPRWNLSKAEQREYIADCLGRKEIVDYLPQALVREDVLPILEIVRNRDVDQLIRLHKKEKRKESIRSNKLLIGLYRKLKG